MMRILSPGQTALFSVIFSLAFFLDVERVGPVEQSDSPLGIVMGQAESHKNFHQDFPAFPAKRAALVLMLAKLI